MQLIRRLTPHLRILLVTFWVGTVWGIGYVAAPALFANLHDRVLAGTIAGHLFRAEALVSLSCGFILLSLLISGRDLESGQRRTGLLLVAVMLACTLIGYFGLQPMMAELRELAGPAGVMASEARSRFGMLHGISAVLHLLQSLAGAWLVLRIR